MKVAMCWDDGHAADLRLLDLFRKYNVKATFNLCPGNMPEQTVMPGKADQESSWNWKGFAPGIIGRRDMVEAYRGFEVASHCWRHENAACGENAKFIQAAVEARKFLEDAFQRPCRGFAWPCGRYDDETVQALKDAGFAYGRTTENTDDVPASFRDDPLRLRSSCHALAADFWRRFQRAAETTGVFYFWGHAFEMADSESSWAYFEERLARLCATPGVEWVNVVDLADAFSPASR
jgi:peptidoglycan/xylan/chitin deacetylase (PgdA/CDA1 family)